MTEKEIECRSALGALYLEVEESVADDFRRIVLAALNEKEQAKKENAINFLRYFQQTAELGFYSTGENHGLPHEEVYDKFITANKEA